MVCHVKGTMQAEGVWRNGDLREISGLNPLNAELNPICCLLALLGAQHFLHVSRIRVNTEEVAGDWRKV